MSNARVVVERLVALCDTASGGDAVVDGQLRAVRTRLQGPLRVAIAGRVKAGKSTLLNALVGERLAATDAGECTRLVSIYRNGLSYDVHAIDARGERRAVPFTRSDGLAIDISSLDLDAVDHLEIDWPSSALRDLTLIDTPGLASLDDRTSARTQRFLGMGTDGAEGASGAEGADAVVYLMRHLHRRDADFLDAFRDRSLADTSPVNAIAVLSRADEIGVGRIDAIDSARRIAARYASDERMRSLASTVIPVAGLVAETGQTLREDEWSAVRTLASIPMESLRDLLLSVDRFVSPDPAVGGDVPVEVRHRLLHRLGMFGLRRSIEGVITKRITSSVELARDLVGVSGLGELRRALEENFAPRADALKARSAIAALRTLPLERRAAAELEAIEAGAHVFSELRMLHNVLSGVVKLGDEEREEVRRLAGAPSAAQRVGLPAADVDVTEVQRHALAGIERWRTKAGSPLASPMTRDVAETAARSYEQIYAEAVDDLGGPRS